MMERHIDLEDFLAEDGFTAKCLATTSQGGGQIFHSLLILVSQL